MEEKRINSGYEIIESHTIGSNELVIGHNAAAPNPYVCWYCKNGSDYFWGYYCNQLSEARKKLNERYRRDKEVVFGVNKKDPYPFMVCCCDYHNPLSAAWPTEGVASDDYLEAMQIFVDRVQSQIDRTKAELAKFPFDKTVFTKKHCIPDDGMRNIVGKVVVINSEPKRYEYQHPAYQLVLADGGNGAIGGRGRAVFGTCLATGEQARWERYDVLGEIKPECMPDWAKEALAKIKAQEKEKKQKSREER